MTAGPVPSPSDPDGGPLVLGEQLLDRARAVFEDSGAHGHEATALIAVGPQGARLVFPTQHPARGPHGVSVTVPPTGQLELITALGEDEIYQVRIHSHPGEAFHSTADDANPVLSHQGALSVVVPYFGLGLRRGLSACAVLRHEAGRWRDLPSGPQRDRHLITSTRSTP